MKAKSNCINQFKKVWYLTHMRAANPNKERDVDEGSDQTFRTSS